MKLPYKPITYKLCTSEGNCATGFLLTLFMSIERVQYHVSLLHKDHADLVLLRETREALPTNVAQELKKIQLLNDHLWYDSAFEVLCSWYEKNKDYFVKHFGQQKADGASRLLEAALHDELEPLPSCGIPEPEPIQEGVAV